MLGAKLCGEFLTDYIKAGSQSCSPQVLETLAHSKIDRIRQRVAENPNTPRDVLELLAADKSPDVRIAVGTNPATPAFISQSLAFDEDLNVRLGLAEDMNTPIEVLDKLIEDPNPYISYHAQQTKQYVQSQAPAKSFDCYRFLKWACTGQDQPGLRYA
ncbi:MAG TPA: hypothetical protein V6D17_10335 [Candidatus Obscuribacterales bacterium]